MRAGLAAAMLSVVFAGQASALERPLPTPNDRTDITYEVTGVISPRCAIDQESHQASFGQILDQQTGGNVARQIDLSFSIDCNSPFQLRMESQNGGLSTDMQGAAVFRRLIPYQAALTVDGRRRGLECTSTQMAASGRDGCNVKFTAERGARNAAGALQLSLDASPAPLLAGRYQDRIVVQISPLVGGDRD
ncbi:hypothetical protein ACIQC9_14030 [Brevundimonas sp. NPDC092305]|uniref:hypothetical protein n=1 Tax=Brevundimonas sp. NPDC092305 TaxID=3363957 RepID=UPI00382EB482